MDYPHVIDPAAGACPLFEFWRPTRDWIATCLFRLAETGVAASVLRRGDKQRGTVMFVLAGRAGDCRYYTQLRRSDGHVFWVRTDHGAGAAWADGTAHLAVQRDPDLWVVQMDARNFAAKAARTAEPASAPASGLARSSAWRAGETSIA